MPHHRAPRSLLPIETQRLHIIRRVEACLNRERVAVILLRASRRSAAPPRPRPARPHLRNVGAGLPANMHYHAERGNEEFLPVGGSLLPIETQRLHIIRRVEACHNRERVAVISLRASRRNAAPPRSPTARPHIRNVGAGLPANVGRGLTY